MEARAATTQAETLAASEKATADTLREERVRHIHLTPQGGSGLNTVFGDAILPSFLSMLLCTHLVFSVCPACLGCFVATSDTIEISTP